MERFRLYLFSILPILITVIIGSVVLYNLDSTKIKTISSDLKLIDANLDHNQALDVIELAKDENIEIPSTIINFDTHSDMYIYENISPDYGARVSNWLNVFFAQNPNANELYWVMPTSEATNHKMIDEFLIGDAPNYPGCLYGNTFPIPPKFNPNVNEQPYEQYFILNTKTGRMKEISASERNTPQDFKKIKIITCTEKTLPDFKNKNLILSIDSDYISNSGFDTLGDFTNNRTEDEISKAISDLLSLLRRKNIRPQIINLTLSPQYVPTEDHQQLFNFIQKFIKYSGKKDTLQQYSHECGKPKSDKQYSSF